MNMLLAGQEKMTGENGEIFARPVLINLGKLLISFGGISWTCRPEQTKESETH